MIRTRSTTTTDAYFWCMKKREELDGPSRILLPVALALATSQDTNDSIRLYIYDVLVLRVEDIEDAFNSHP